MFWPRFYRPSINVQETPLLWISTKWKWPKKLITAPEWIAFASWDTFSKHSKYNMFILPHLVKTKKDRYGFNGSNWYHIISFIGSALQNPNKSSTPQSVMKTTWSSEPEKNSSLPVTCAQFYESSMCMYT